MTYQLLDSGDGKKLESFQGRLVIRPSLSAIWKIQKPELWKKVDLTFSREKGWKGKKEDWRCEHEQIQFHLSPTDFGHLGIFPEHMALWKQMEGSIGENDRILNLFAYTGGASFVAAKKGAEVVHVDASKPSLLWAKKNALLNKLANAPIRYILDDAVKFVKREVKRKSLYEGIILDPPTFGRGAKNEVFKIERDLLPLLQMCFSLLSKKAKFFALSCHTPGYTPIVLKQVLMQYQKEADVREMALLSENGFHIPVGSCAIWKKS